MRFAGFAATNPVAVIELAIRKALVATDSERITATQHRIDRSLIDPKRTVGLIVGPLGAADPIWSP